MLLKPAAIEVARTHKQLELIALHPDILLSQPFSAKLPPDKLFPSELTAQRLVQVIESLRPRNSG